MADPLQSAFAAAREAGAVLLEHLHWPLHIQEKLHRADLVTEADKASEAVIVARLHAEYPSATILGEESGERKGTSQERRIVDPLDGTTNFAHGYPLFCVSIAYERSGELVAAVVNAPLMNELFAAERGAGARVNDNALHVSSIASIDNAMVSTGRTRSGVYGDGPVRWFLGIRFSVAGYGSGVLLVFNSSNAGRRSDATRCGYRFASH